MSLILILEMCSNAFIIFLFSCLYIFKNENQNYYFQSQVSQNYVFELLYYVITKQSSPRVKFDFKIGVQLNGIDFNIRYLTCFLILSLWYSRLFQYHIQLKRCIYISDPSFFIFQILLHCASDDYYQHFPYVKLRGYLQSSLYFQCF